MAKRGRKRSRNSKSIPLTITRLTRKVKVPLTNARSREGLARRITPIATGVAVISGIVAIGTALSDKRNRETLSKTAQQGWKMLQQTTNVLKEEMPERYQAIAHQITPRKKGARKQSRSSLRGRKSR